WARALGGRAPLMWEPRAVPAPWRDRASWGRTPAARAARMESRPNADLDALMARLADGDRSVLKAVFEALWGPIERLCRSWLGNEADAADAAQEAMHKILERASDYDRARPALPWALAIAGFECRTLARRRQRRREGSADVRDDLAGPDTEL